MRMHVQWCCMIGWLNLDINDFISEEEKKYDDRSTWHSFLGHGNISARFNIIGFPKCGQVSLQTYCHFMWDDVATRRDEIIWRKDIDKEINKIWDKTIQLVVIMREPISACWSNYWDIYKAHKPDHTLSYEDFLTYSEYHQDLGELNPISCYNYAKWLKPIYKYNPILLDMEEVRKNINFPHENKTKNIPTMPQHYKDLTRKLLDKEIEEHKEPSWSVDY